MAGGISLDWRVRQLRPLLPTWKLYHVRLFTSGPVPSAADRWYDYREPQGAWYAPQLLTDLTGPAPNDAGQAQVQSGVHTWALGAGDGPATIAGVWVSDERGRYVTAQTLDAPVQLAGAGASFAAAVAFTF